jgi:long-chain acyl-CoA synthetase
MTEIRHRREENSLSGSIAEVPQAAPTESLDMLRMFHTCVTEQGENPALYYFDRNISYRELDAQSDALSCWLLGRGVVEGDRVAIILQNVPQFVMMTVAAWKIGAIPLPINPMYRVTELSRILADAEPKVALCFSGQVSEVLAAEKQAGIALTIIATAAQSFQSRNDPRVLSVQGEVTPAAPTLERILSEATVMTPPNLQIDGESLGLLLYTSGTTGVPKGAMIRHRNLGFNAQSLRDSCGLSPQSRILAIAPLFHITGFVCHIAAAFSARASLILHFRVEPTLLLEVIREHRPTFAIGAITAFNALSSVCGLSHEDMQCFDRIYSGGAPIAPALLERIEAQLGKKIHSTYGMTETTAPTHLAPFMARIPVDPDSGALSIGKLLPGTSAKIVGDQGQVLPVGVAGELMVKGLQVMKGYWRKPKDTSAALEDGWMHTGDVALVDGDGWYFLVDRLKDVIIASGFKVWPREVEDVLYTHAAVREAAVIGAPDSYRGETVKAFVSLKKGVEVDADELIDHCREHLAAYKVPRSVEILPELPKTVTGKIQRTVLRQS